MTPGLGSVTRRCSNAGMGGEMGEGEAGVEVGRVRRGVPEQRNREAIGRRHRVATIAMGLIA